MLDTFKESTFVQLVRLVSGDRYIKYEEEREVFKFASLYNGSLKLPHESGSPEAVDDPASILQDTPTDDEKVQGRDRALAPSLSSDPSHYPSGMVAVPDNLEVGTLQRTATAGIERTRSLPMTNERLQAELMLSVEKTISRAVVPMQTNEGYIVVDWYTTDDPANPQNWSQKKKTWVSSLMVLYTFAVYAGSSIYVSSEVAVMQKFGVADFKAALPLSLYVLGYGLGPLVFSPISEIPRFGRNVPYVASFALFIILCVPASLVDNLGGFVFLRFLLGFFGSPCLANGGATMQDMYSLLYLPYAVACWVSAAFAAPAVGPLLSGFSVPVKGWRWANWEVLWLASPVFVMFLFTLPETSADTILARRAARLRRRFGNEKIQSRSEIVRDGLTFNDIMMDALVKPIEIMLKDPAVLFTAVYSMLMYGIYYSFFEAFPLVYPVFYGFNIGETALIFLCIVVGCIIAMAVYFSYLNWYLIPDILKNGLRAQEHRLVPALIASFGPVIGLFMFGWTARATIHWIVPTIGLTIYAFTVYIVFQCIFSYIPMSYPPYAASLFAGNDFMRSAMAFGSGKYGSLACTAHSDINSALWKTPLS